jgi:hypothetical protein
MNADRYVSQFYRENVLSGVFSLIKGLSVEQYPSNEKVFPSKLGNNDGEML